MKRRYKNNRIESKGDLPLRIEKSLFLGRIVIFLFDIFFIIYRRIFLLFNKNISGNLIVVSFQKLGDSVFAIPAIKEIVKYYKNYNIIIFCYPESKNIYDLVFKEHKVILNKEDFKFGLRIASAGARKMLKKENPEIIFDLTGTIASASLIFSSAAPQVIGMNDRLFKSIYTQFTKKRTLPHLIDTYLDIANLTIPIERKEEIYLFNSSVNKNGKILIHPFAGWKAKEWNLEKFIRLGGILKDKYEIAFILPKNSFSSEVQVELGILDIPLIITESVDELINELKKCSLIISNDSGPVYIASLFGKPTFTIYGPTNPAYSIPFGTSHGYIQKKIECSPEENNQYCLTDAGRNGCPLFECMNLLTVDEVFENLNQFIIKLGIEQKK